MHNLRIGSDQLKEICMTTKTILEILQTYRGTEFIVEIDGDEVIWWGQDGDVVSIQTGDNADESSAYIYMRANSTMASETTMGRKLFQTSNFRNMYEPFMSDVKVFAKTLVEL